MAEGWARRLCADRIEVWSAGVAPTKLDTRAVAAMAECGVDISGQRSKPLDELAGVEFDRVVTVCDNARESCPVFGGKTRVLHVDLDDPPRLAADSATDAEAMSHYRRVRDEIRAFVEGLPAALDNANEGAMR